MSNNFGWLSFKRPVPIKRDQNRTGLPPKVAAPIKAPLFQRGASERHTQQYRIKAGGVIESGADQEAPGIYQSPEMAFELLFCDLAAPAQDFGFRACGFCFLDIAGAVVKQRKTCPPDLIVRPQFYCAFAGFNRFLESPELHQSHPQGVPAIEKIRVKLHAPPVLLSRADLNHRWQCHRWRHQKSRPPLPSILLAHDHNGHKELRREFSNPLRLGASCGLYVRPSPS